MRPPHTRRIDAKLPTAYAAHPSSAPHLDHGVLGVAKPVAHGNTRRLELVDDPIDLDQPLVEGREGVDELARQEHVLVLELVAQATACLERVLFPEARDRVERLRWGSSGWEGRVGRSEWGKSVA